MGRRFVPGSGRTTGATGISTASSRMRAWSGRTVTERTSLVSSSVVVKRQWLVYLYNSLCVCTRVCLHCVTWCVCVCLCMCACVCIVLCGVCV